jgi:hypothetical protein
VKAGSEVHPASNSMGIGDLPWGQNNRGVKLTTHCHLVKMLRMNRAVPPLPLYALKTYTEIIFLYESHILAEPVKVAAEPVKVAAEPVKVAAEPVKVAAEPVKVAAEPEKVAP